VESGRDTGGRVEEVPGLGEMSRRRTLCRRGEYRRHRMTRENWGERGGKWDIGLTYRNAHAGQWDEFSPNIKRDCRLESLIFIFCTWASYLYSYGNFLTGFYYGMRWRTPAGANLLPPFILAIVINP
jgi:hypothetical protein